MTGALVTIQLPDTGRQVKVAVGQDWVDELGYAVGAAQEGSSRKVYRVKWVQDDSGALTVLEVAAVLSSSRHQQLRHSGFSDDNRGAAGQIMPGQVLAPVSS